MPVISVLGKQRQGRSLGLSGQPAEPIFKLLGSMGPCLNKPKNGTVSMAPKNDTEGLHMHTYIHMLHACTERERKGERRSGEEEVN